jgi:hypothetical protein
MRIKVDSGWTLVDFFKVYTFSPGQNGPIAYAGLLASARRRQHSLRQQALKLGIPLGIAGKRGVRSFH